MSYESFSLLSPLTATYAYYMEWPPQQLSYFKNTSLDEDDDDGDSNNDNHHHNDAE